MSRSEPSPREREIVTLLAQGFESKEIARKMNLGVRTVQNHRYRVCKKLKVTRLAHLVLYAVRQGWVTP